MKKNIMKTFLIIPFLIILIFSIQHYLSEKNIKYINKSRTSYALLLMQNNDYLEILKSDTDNAIIYISDSEKYKNIKKPRIWEDLISDEN